MMKAFISVVLIVTLALLVLVSPAATAAILYVGPGETYTEIQPALDASANGDIITVLDGTYATGPGDGTTRYLDFKGKAITLRSENGPGNCVIDCQSSPADPARGFYFHTAETLNSVLEGFTITNGGNVNNGGAINCTDASPAILDCILSGNSANSYGGGVYLDNSSASIDRCIIQSNSAVSGGGIQCWDSSPDIMNCIIAGNSVTPGYGGGIYCWLSFPEIKHCTIAGNSAAYGGGISAVWYSSPMLTNCILWNNSASEGTEIALYDAGVSLTIDYSNVGGGQTSAYAQGGTTPNWGANNIDADPLFAGVDDFHLTTGSLCIDIGTDAGVYIDIDGDTRPQGTGFDIGADEYVDLPDLSISEIQPVQVVFEPHVDENGTIDLVVGRETAVLVDIGLTNSLSLPADTLVEISVTDGSSTMGTFRTIHQLDVDNQVEFFFVAKEGDYEFTATIDPVDMILESNETNNQTSVEATGKKTIPLSLSYMNVLAAGGLPVDSELTYNKSNELILATYPVDPTTCYTTFLGIPILGSQVPLFGMIEDMMHVYIAGLLANPLATVGRYYRAVGIVSNFYFSQHLYFGTHGISFPGIHGVLAETGYWSATAHEIGHTLGLNLPTAIGGEGEEYSDDIFANITDGYWVNRRQKIDLAFCFMGGGLPEDSAPLPYWVERDCYEKIFRALRVDPEDPELLLVSGIFNSDGTVHIDNWYYVPVGTPTDILPGEQLLQFMNSSGAIVEEVSFTASFIMQLEPGGAVEVDWAPFAFATPYPSDAVAVKIIDHGNTVAEVDLSSKLLHNAIDAIPEHGIDKNNPDATKKSLHNKVLALEEIIRQGDIQQSLDKLQSDIRDKFEKRLIDAYTVTKPTELTKEQILDLTDSLYARLQAQQ